MTSAVGAQAQSTTPPSPPSFLSSGCHSNQPKTSGVTPIDCPCPDPALHLVSVSLPSPCPYRVLQISPWHDIPAYVDEARGIVNFVNEIPRYASAYRHRAPALSPCPLSAGAVVVCVRHVLTNPLFRHQCVSDARVPPPTPQLNQSTHRALLLARSRSLTVAIGTPRRKWRCARKRSTIRLSRTSRTASPGITMVQGLRHCLVLPTRFRQRCHARAPLRDL